ASGTNSGILHTGFDSPPGEFETDLILRAARLREPVLDELGVPVRHCGAILRARNDDEEAIVDLVARGADVNGVEVHREDERTLSVPGESITDPVAYTRALIAAAEMGGAQLRTRARVERIARIDGEL